MNSVRRVVLPPSSLLCSTRPLTISCRNMAKAAHKKGKQIKGKSTGVVDFVSSGQKMAYFDTLEEQEGSNQRVEKLSPDVLRKKSTVISYARELKLKITENNHKLLQSVAEERLKLRLSALSALKRVNHKLYDEAYKSNEEAFPLTRPLLSDTPPKKLINSDI